MQIFKTKKILKRDEDLKFKTPTDIFGQYIDENLEFDFEFGIESLTKNYDSRYKQPRSASFCRSLSLQH